MCSSLLSLCALCFGIGCEPPKPSVVDLTAPRGVINTLGPYRFKARVYHQTERVTLKWRVETPLEGGEDETAWSELEFNLEGGVWTTELASDQPLAIYEYYLEASGPGGVTREPIIETERFQVIASTSPCSVDAECLSGFQCRSGQCIPEPTDPTDPPDRCAPACEAGERCVSGSCVRESTCTRDVECPADSACDLSRGVCARGPRGRFCAPCGLESSEFSEECGVGYACLEGFSGCRPLCGSSGPDAPPCGEDEVCEEGICVIPDYLACRSWECALHTDCQSGLCEKGRCAHAQPCDEMGRCGEGKRCVDGLCVFTPECEYDSCPVGSVCLGGQCEPLGARALSCLPCQRDDECGSLAHCYFDEASDDEGSCLQLCERDDHCFGGQLCTQISVMRYCLYRGDGYLCE